MKKVIGWLMICLFFVGLIYFLSLGMGLSVAVLIFLVAVVFAGYMYLAVHLIT